MRRAHGFASPFKSGRLGARVKGAKVSWGRQRPASAGSSSVGRSHGKAAGLECTGLAGHGVTFKGCARHPRRGRAEKMCVVALQWPQRAEHARRAVSSADGPSRCGATHRPHDLLPDRARAASAALRVRLPTSGSRGSCRLRAAQRCGARPVVEVLSWGLRVTRADGSPAALTLSCCGGMPPSPQ